MNNLNEFFDDAVAATDAHVNNEESHEPVAVDSQTFKGTIAEIETEIKERHDWLEQGKQQIVIDHLTVEHQSTDFDNMITKLAPTNIVLGWGLINSARNELKINLNVDPKMGAGMREHGAINVRVTKLNRPADGGATHKCEYRGRAVTNPSFKDGSSRLMLAVNSFEGLDEFSFDLSPKLIANFIYKAHGKTWLRLHAKREGNLISIYC